MILTPAHIEAIEDDVLALCLHGYSLDAAISRLLVSFEDCRFYFSQTAPNPQHAEEYRLAQDYLRKKRLGIA